MKKKIYYFNDTRKSQQIFAGHIYQEGFILEPSSGRYFEIQVRRNFVPFIKIWDNGCVLISDIPKELKV